MTLERGDKMSRTSISKLVLLPLLLAFCGCFLITGYAQPTKEPSKKEKREADKLMKEGETAFRQKNFQEAVKKLGDSLAIVSTNAKAHFLKGSSHHSLAQYEQAASELELAQKYGYKEMMDVLELRADAYEKLKKYDESLRDVNGILATDPGNHRYNILAAGLYTQKGAYKEAADALTKALPKAQNSADLYYRIAEARSKYGDIEGQAAAAEEAIKRNTSFLADSQVLLGQARYAQKRIPEAITAYSKALASRPDKLEAYRNLARLYRSQNQIDEAIKTLEEGKDRNATNGEVYKDLSLAYSLGERFDAAVGAGASAAQLLPDDPVAHMYLCRAYVQVEKWELATGSCNKALNLAREDGESLYWLARAYEGRLKPADAAGYYKRSAESLESFTKNFPEDPDGFYVLGNAYADLRQYPKALEAYRRALELNPKFARVNFNIGVVKILENNKPAALEQYDVLLLADKRLADRLKKEIDKKWAS